MRRPLGDEAIAGTRGGRRTALKTVRYYGSARAGTEHFIKQRVTAVANIFLVLFLAVVAILLTGRSYSDAVALVGAPWVAVPLALAIVSVCIHFRLGVQVVIEDYVHDNARIVLLLLNTFFAVAVAAAGLFAIVRIVLVVMSAAPIPEA